jgi:3-oxoacyl-[acyl-carrier protein] reductase
MAGALQDKVAIVTGAGRGVGREIALLMAREGARVVVADNGSEIDGSGRAADPAETVAAEILSEGGEAVASATDVSDWDEARKMVDAPIEQWGKLDILVNCAGNFVRDTIADVTPASLEKVRRVHLDGMVNTSHFAALHWVKRGEYGRLINFTSDSAVSGVPDTFSYAVVKGAVIALTRSAANALVGYNVTANALTQGSRTRMVDHYHGPAAGGITPPEELPATVAPLVTYLASPAAAYVSGRVFGSYGHRYIRWSEQVHEAVLESDGPWSLESLFERFPQTLGDGLSPEKDLRYPLAELKGLEHLPTTTRKNRNW